MPELPEVETVCRGLAPTMLSSVIEDVTLFRPNLRVPFSDGLAEKLTGRRVQAIHRRAKYIVITLDDESLLVIHLGMSGRIRFESAHNKQPHDHFTLRLSSGEIMIYTDPRRFGMVLWFDDKAAMAAHPSFHSLGPEPFDDAFNTGILKKRFKDKKTPIKTALLDQRVVAGLGNIYVCEALYKSGIHPARATGTLSTAELDALIQNIRSVLDLAIRKGGSTLKDFRHADGALGYFQHNFTVYDRAGISCPNAPANDENNHLITRVIQGGRSSFYCPACQK